MIIETDKENSDYKKLNGVFIYGDKQIYFNVKNCCLRGSYLRNTDYLIGIVLGTGKETKMI